MAALPKQVRDQIAAADEISKEIHNPQPVGEEEDAPEQAEAEDKGQPAEANFEADSQEVDQEEEDQEGEQEDDEGPNSATFEARWKTLQGLYNSATKQNTMLQGRVESLENMLAQLQQLRETAPAAAPEPEQPGYAPITSEEEEEYGPGLIDVMRRAATEAVRDQLDELRKENQKLKTLIGSVGQKQDASDANSFYGQLGELVPDWKKLNTDPQFLEWLDQDDVYAGDTRRALLNQAFQKKDAKRVSYFFKGYARENAAVAPRPDDAPPNPKGSGKAKLESMVAPGPGSSGSADNTSKSSSRMWKESEIGAFYESARQGKFKGRATEYRRMEEQIQAAMNEGRIIVGR